MRNAILILILPVILSLSCGSGIGEGILIGAGSSKLLTEVEQLAEKSRNALMAEVLNLRKQLDNTTDPATVVALRDKLKTAEKKQEMAELTDAIAAQVKAGLDRDWSEPASADNLTWLLGAGAGIASIFAGKKTLDDKKKGEAIARIKIAAKEGKEQEVYKAARTA